METRQCRVRIATKKDADYIARNLRVSDVEELTDGGLTTAAVSESFTRSTYCRCMCAPDGKPFAIWGCGRIADDIGSVWMLATDDLENHRIAFGRICAGEVRHMLSIYPLLTNYVHVSNIRSQRWLTLLGAKLVPERCMSSESKFRQFWFERVEELL